MQQEDSLQEAMLFQWYMPNVHHSILPKMTSIYPKYILSYLILYEHMIDNNTRIFGDLSREIWGVLDVLGETLQLCRRDKVQSVVCEDKIHAIDVTPTL